MSITRETKPHEILLVLGRAGLLGAQVRDVEYIVLDETGEVINQQWAGNPRAVAGDDLDAILGEATRVAIEENSALKVEVARLTLIENSYNDLRQREAAFQASMADAATQMAAAFEARNSGKSPAQENQA